MGAIKRFFMNIFCISALTTLIASVLGHVGPWANQVHALLASNPFDMVYLALAAISLLGLVILFLRSLMSKNTNSIEVETSGGGRVSVTRDAIASQAAHVIESDGTCVAKEVVVRAKKKGHVKVAAKVLPHASIDVLNKGEELRSLLTSELHAICGDKLEKVSVEFLQPESTQRVTPTTPNYSAPEPVIDQMVPGAVQAQATSEISVNPDTLLEMPPAQVAVHEGAEQ